jgi:hypothetical protein
MLEIPCKRRSRIKQKGLIVKKLTLIIAVIIMTCPASARDLNRQNYALGERAAGMGGAFVSVVGDPASSYYNPAGLAGLYKRGLSLSASVYQLLIEDYSKIIDFDPGDGGRLSADMSSTTFGTFPSSVVYLLPLDSNKEPEAFHHVIAFSLLVPDYDKMKAKIDMPIGDYAFELKGNFYNEDITYWAGPSYAVAFGGKLRIGLSAFALVHMTEERANLGVKATTFDTNFGDYVSDYLATTFETTGLGLSMLVQLGAQYDISDNLTIGLTVRSPTFGSFYSQVRMLTLNNYYREDMAGNPLVTAANPGYADRIESEDIEMNYKVPLMIAAGINYHVEESFVVALDVSFHLGLPKYNLYSGSLVYPKDPTGAIIYSDDRALDPNTFRQASWVINANLGAEVNFTKDYMARFGLFTDFSAVDQGSYDWSLFSRQEAIALPRLNRFGAALGFGMIGERTTTSFIVNYVIGIGDTFSLNEMFVGVSSKSDVLTHTVTFALAGSADL